LGKTNREGCHGKTLKNRAPPLLLGAAVREPRRRHQPPPQQRQKRSKPPPLCQVTILYPHSCFFFPFLHAERIAFCMQGWGENNPPRPFWLLGQADPGPALPSGPVLVQKGILDFWAKVGPIHFGPRSAQHLWGCVRPSWLGRPSPAQFNFILCILFVCCIIYIYIYIYIYEKITKILQKLF